MALMFISFEGIDGCGKTTQINLLEKYFIDRNKKVIKLREPGGTDFSETIREILLNSRHDISPVSELMLFNAARADLINKVIKPELDNGAIVICDRFYDSTTAYQGYGRGLNLEEVTQSNMLATQGLKPDITFYIDIPLEISHERSKNRNPDRMERSGDNFFQKVIDGFREISRLESERVLLIDGSGDIEATYQKIIKVIEKRDF